MQTIAAIDIGSNAIRLVVAKVNAQSEIRLIKKFREPVRLGEDVFSQGAISAKTVEKAVRAFQNFRQFMKDQNVAYAKAVATSAVREATNRDEFVKKIKDTTGIQIEIIDGREEARLIYSAVASKVDLQMQNSVLIDIGGGSVELTVTDHQTIVASESFRLGTVRLLNLLKERKLKEKQIKSVFLEHFPPIQKFLEIHTKDCKITSAIGTGGNFECLGKLRVALLNKTSVHSMTFMELHQIYEHLLSMSVRERIKFLRLRPDRADVIVPAALLAQEIMAATPVHTLMVPYVGLRDGILTELSHQILHL